MDTLATPAEFSSRTGLRIAHGSVARILDGRGVLVRVQHGNVWLTQDSANEDVCLEAGQSFRIEHDGLTLVSALGDASFALVSLDPSISYSRR